MNTPGDARTISEAGDDLTLEQGETLRRAMTQARGTLPPKHGRLGFPVSALKAALWPSLPVNIAMLKPTVPVVPSWITQMKLVNSDIYKVAGGRPNLIDLNSILAKNADFGFGTTAAKFAAQFATQQGSSLKAIAPLLDSFKTSIYPPNLRGIEKMRLKDIEAVVMLDGIALYGVPRADIAEKIIRAESSAARRKILGWRWKAISADCRTALEGCTSGATTPFVSFIVAALDALDAGNPPAAQALGASVMDTVVNGYFGRQRYALTPNKRTTTAAEYDKFTVREFIAFSPLWQAYQKFQATGGDPIPTTFSRHATVHGVSARQFSRRNAVQAVLFASSLLLFLDERASALDAAKHVERRSQTRRR